MSNPQIVETSESEGGFEAHESDDEQLWEAVAIVKEKPGFYLVKWAGNRPDGKPWPNSWARRCDITDDLVHRWKEEKGTKKKKKKGKAEKKVALKSNVSVGSSRASTIVRTTPTAGSSSRSLRSNATASVGKSEEYESISRDGSKKRRASKPLPVPSDDDEPPRPPSKRRKVTVSNGKPPNKPLDQIFSVSKGRQISSPLRPSVILEKTPSIRKHPLNRRISFSSSDEGDDNPPATAIKAAPLPTRFRSERLVEQSQALAPGGDAQLEQFNRDLAALPEPEGGMPLGKPSLFLPSTSDEESTDPPRRASKNTIARQRGSPTATEYQLSAPPSPQQASVRPINDDFRVGDVPETQSTEGDEDDMQEVVAPQIPKPTLKAKMKPRSPAKSLNPMVLYTPTRFKDTLHRARLPEHPDENDDSIRTFSSPVKGKKTQEQEVDDAEEQSQRLRRRGIELADAVRAERRAQNAQYVPQRAALTLDDIIQRHNPPPAQEGVTILSTTESEANGSQPVKDQVLSDVVALRQEEEESTQDMMEYLNEAELAAGDKELDAASDGTGYEGHSSSDGEAIRSITERSPDLDLPERVAFYAEMSQSQSQQGKYEIEEGDDPESLVYHEDSLFVEQLSDRPNGGSPARSRSSSSVIVNPDSQLALPPTASTEMNSPAQKSQIPSEEPATRLEAAMQLLNEKSNEIIRLGNLLADEQMSVLAERAKNAVLQAQAQSSVLARDNNLDPNERLNKALEEKGLADNRALAAEEARAALQVQLENAQRDSAYNAQQVETLREAYMKASAFSDEATRENKKLQAELEISQAQTRNGVALIKATFEQRETQLRAEVTEWRNQAKFLREQAIRTNDDDLRRRAAEHPELAAKCLQLAEEKDDLEEQLEQLTEDLSVAKDECARAQQDCARLEDEPRPVALHGDMLIYRCHWRTQENVVCPVLVLTKEGLDEHTLMHVQLQSSMLLLNFIGLSLLQMATASLYPTYPIRDSVFFPDTIECVTWTDSVSSPRLSEMGSLSIDLCNTYGDNCIRLAHKVSPRSRSHCVHIPANLTTWDHYVFILETCSPTTQQFWTADFTVNTPASQLTPPPPSDGNRTNIDRLLTLVLPTTTLVSEIPPALTTIPAAITITAGPPPADGGGGIGLNRLGSPNASAPRKGNHLHKTRLRLFYVLWPSLIGVSLAL
ncbi:hypothetical protein MIND_00618800 [Mycena indigotica]|uniref:Chromo domain-containing protein n=1 Tax=Mycena indigotica TaxID=2126181 RepID=A0A8H6W3S8_9AGAR|nr:uncharacterized protein MIND_00618800 [Mycena indigotica]KAF7303887.1 hypothetical protein MIND_00618800 [Mycena indigotica]